MNAPQWFTDPNKVQTEKDIKEILEYDRVHLQIRQQELENMYEARIKESNTRY
jgi:hypothetical protein